MVRPLSLTQHTLYAELLEQGSDQLFDPELPENGSILMRPDRSGTLAQHAYYQGYRSNPGDEKRGQRYGRYLGRAADPAIAERIARFRRVKEVRSERATTVRALIGAGMPRPDRMTGYIVEALARAKLFPDHAVLLGEAAFQTYGGILGVRWPERRKAAPSDRSMVEICVRDRHALPALRDALGTFDPSFEIDPEGVQTHHSFGGSSVVVSVADRGRKSDPNDFLIAKPVRALVLHGPGIPISVPAPERHVVWALISQRLSGTRPTIDTAFVGDPRSTGQLIDGLELAGRRRAIGSAIVDARAVGSEWNTAITDAIGDLPAASRTLLAMPL